MEKNFEEKIEKLKNLLAHWSYRFFTPFGKITIIKSLALSKLSHLALVIPNPSKQMLKSLETILFKFLWGKKSEKVSREDAKLPEKLGGLGMPDIEKFWSAFKFSWVRRLITSESYWPNIIMTQISQLLGQQTTPCQLFELGPTKLCHLSKSLKNKFWAQVLQTTVPLIEGEIFCRPEKLVLSSVWHNPLIRRNNKVLRPEDFPEIAKKISTLSSFYYPGTNKFMELQDFREKYCDNFCNLKFIDLRYCISLALQKINFPTTKLMEVHYPMIPLLIDVALSTTKGCSKYYKILTKSKILNNKLHIREEKWHSELQALHSIDFWDKTRKLYSSISFNNNLKWLQFQIVRNSLQTNYIVSHFIRNISPLCKFCGQADEQISHLFGTAIL